MEYMESMMNNRLEASMSEYEQMTSRIAQLEEELAKVTARYNYVRDMTPEDFGDLSTINDDFDRKIDELIKERITQLESDLAESQKVIKVVDSLVTAKGRYHTAQWYQKMVTALDEYKAAVKEQQ